MDTVGNHDEIVATGDLFKQAKRQVNNWKLRKFLLSGIYLTYFDDNGSVKGRIDISGCVVRRMSPAECKNPACKYAFGLFTSRSVRRCLICATNEEDRTAWINAIEAQITEFQDVVRRFITNNEVVLGNSLVTKKNLIGMETSFRLVITNFPRILVIEPNSISLKEQILFKLESPPTIQILDDISFIIRYKVREFKWKDNRGSSYWASIFHDLPDMPTYVPKVKPPLNIGEVLVSAAPSEASLRRAMKREQAQKSTSTAGVVRRPNRMPALPHHAFTQLKLGLSGGSRNQEASFAPLVASQLIQAQVLGDADSENQRFSSGYEEDYGDEEAASDDGEEENTEDEEEFNESIEVLKVALGNVRNVVTTLSKEIEEMAAPKARKQELVRALMLNVSALSSNLQGLYAQGMASEEGVDADLIGTITDVVDETAELLQHLTTGASSASKPADRAQFIETVNNGIGDMSNYVATQIANRKN